MADYVAHWTKVLSVLNIDKFSEIKQSNDLLARFTDPVYSPLISILQVTATHTQLSSQLLQNLNDDQGDGKAGGVTQALASKFKGTKVDQQFRSFECVAARGQ